MAEIIRYGNDSGTQIRKSSDYIDEADLGRYATELKEHLKNGTQIRDIGVVLESYKLFSPFDYMNE